MINLAEYTLPYTFHSFGAAEKKTKRLVVKDFFISFVCYYPPRGKWADPGGTAIPGQPVERAEQAPDISPMFKNQFNIEVLRWRTYQILS